MGGTKANFRQGNDLALRSRVENDSPMTKEILPSEWMIRLSSFLGIFVLMSLWE
jgi:hypothetical protein